MLYIICRKKNDIYDWIVYSNVTSFMLPSFQWTILSSEKLENMNARFCYVVNDETSYNCFYTRWFFLCKSSLLTTSKQSNV